MIKYSTEYINVTNPVTKNEGLQRRCISITGVVL